MNISGPSTPYPEIVACSNSGLNSCASCVLRTVTNTPPRIATPKTSSTKRFIYYTSESKYAYPSFSISAFPINLSAAPFMQYRFPPRSFGPSSKTCPTCESAYLERTSVRVLKSFLSLPAMVRGRHINSCKSIYQVHQRFQQQDQAAEIGVIRAGPRRRPGESGA